LLEDKKMLSNLISIIGDAYLEPICVLLEKLEKLDEREDTTIQSGFSVNGFSASICLLAVACLESYTMRVRYIKKADQRELDKDPVTKYLSKIFPSFPYTEELSEIYIVRDVITHNHLWEISFKWTNDSMDLIEANNRNSGDNKYRSNVNLLDRCTRKLGLNVNPINISMSDVHIVLKTMWKILVYIQEQDLQLCSVTEEHYLYHGKLARFGEIVGNFQAPRGGQALKT
jgi:hypothetical protein